MLQDPFIPLLIFSLRIKIYMDICHLLVSMGFILYFNTFRNNYLFNYNYNYNWGSKYIFIRISLPVLTVGVIKE